MIERILMAAQLGKSLIKMFIGKTNVSLIIHLIVCRGTFYLSHEWSDYSQVQNLYSKGHEMASHSIR